MDLTRNDISPKTENSEDKVLKSKSELIFIRIYVLCTLLRRLVFNGKEFIPLNLTH